MNRSQRVVVASRDHGRHRVGQVTRWTAAGGGLALAVIGVVLAQGPASASTAAPLPAAPGPTPTPPAHVSPPQHPHHRSNPPGRNSPDLSQYGSPSTQRLQPPAAVPQYSFGGGSHASSGAS